MGVRCDPPGRGDFSISNFHPGPIPGNLDETIFGVREVARAEGVACFFEYLLGKNYWRRDRNHLVLPEAGCMQRSPAVLGCAILGRKHERTGCETTPVHYAAWRCGG